MDFRFIHIYQNTSIDSRVLADKISKVFPSCEVDVRPAFRYDERIEQARIVDIFPPEDRPGQKRIDIVMYDGFLLQQIFGEMIPLDEASHIHVIVTGLLACTLGQEDCRYHARGVVCGTPSLISIPGIVEGPAKPKEFYFAQLRGISDISLKKMLAGRFIDFGDTRMTSAATLYALQALFFFVADGEPFCRDNHCSLYNAHWQEELIDLIKNGSLCDRHNLMANKFNNRK